MTSRRIVEVIDENRRLTAEVTSLRRAVRDAAELLDFLGYVSEAMKVRSAMMEGSTDVEP